MNKHNDMPLHFRYCGTQKPDQFLIETAYRFVCEMIRHGPVEIIF